MLWALTLLATPAVAWLDQLLRRAGTELAWLRLSSIPQEAAAVSAATVGAVLTARRPRHPVGWLLLGLGLSLILWGLTFSYTRYGLVARPGALPAAGYLAGFHTGSTLICLSCASFLLLLTPPLYFEPSWLRALEAQQSKQLLPMPDFGHEIEATEVVIANSDPRRQHLDNIIHDEPERVAAHLRSWITEDNK